LKLKKRRRMILFSCAVFSVCSKCLWVSSAVFVVSSNCLWALARFSSVTSLFFFKVASCSSRAALARRSASSCYRRSLSVDEADFEEHPDCRPAFFRNVFDMELSSVSTLATTCALDICSSPSGTAAAFKASISD